MNKLQPLLIKPIEAAALLSVSRGKIYEMIQQGAVPSIRVGGLIRIPREAIEKLAAEAMAGE